jgi:hypothetical protein
MIGPDAAGGVDPGIDVDPVRRRVDLHRVGVRDGGAVAQVAQGVAAPAVHPAVAPQAAREAARRGDLLERREHAVRRPVAGESGFTGA